MYIKITSEAVYVQSHDKVYNRDETVEIDTVDHFAVEEANALIESKDVVRVWQPDDFVISQIVGDVKDPTQIDFTIIGLRKETPKYEKGRKTACQYFFGDTLAVAKTFTDVIEEDQLVGIEIVFTWYNLEGNVKATKAERAVTFNKYSALTEQRKRRERAVDYLVAGSVDTPLETYVALIFEHYRVQIQTFISTGSSVFQEAIQSEANPQISQLLGIEVAPEKYPGFTLAMSMLGQIT